jgi:uncharacterized protein YceK
LRLRTGFVLTFPMSKTTRQGSVLLLLFLFSTGSSGCGTYLNVTAKDDPGRPSFVFGGVARDVGLLGTSSIIVYLDSQTEDEDGSSTYEFEQDDTSNEVDLLFLLTLIDLPFSVVGDIVTLPVILDKNRIPSHVQEKKRGEGPFSGMHPNGPFEDWGRISYSGISTSLTRSALVWSSFRRV